MNDITTIDATSAFQDKVKELVRYVTNAAVGDYQIWLMEHESLSLETKRQLLTVYQAYAPNGEVPHVKITY
jgi:hypothetical protein